MGQYNIEGGIMIKKLIIKAIDVLLILALLNSYTPKVLANDSSGAGTENYELYCTEQHDEDIDAKSDKIFTLDDDIKADVIYVTFKHMYSVPNKVWKSENFFGINIESIKDGTF